ncbi:unnamed protein product, partial [marine sediment metagenome]
MIEIKCDRCKKIIEEETYYKIIITIIYPHK